MSKGQALLLILLIVAVVLTIFLAVFSRSISDVSVSKQDEESYRAFSAAEAGVEKSLLTENLTFLAPNPLDLGGTAVTGSIAPALASSSYVYPLQIVSGDVANFWLVDHSATDGSLVCNLTDHRCTRVRKVKICWGDSPTITTTTPAVELSVYYLNTDSDYSTARVARAAFDPNTSRVPTNGFDSSSLTTACVINGVNFAFSKVLALDDLNITNNAWQNNKVSILQMLRARMVYADKGQYVGLDISNTGVGGQNGEYQLLPPQGRTIVSSATTSTGTSTRKLEVFQPYSDLPPVFDAAVFSLPGLVK